jgi:xanthine/CO dehydrogenase XdhC/CoxF family maturation factor
MKEISQIIDFYDKLDHERQKVALASVVQVEGSSYRRIGARMLISEDGTWVGGISGGCLEGDALRRAKLAIFKKTSSVVRYDTTQDDEHQIGVGLGCNGIIDILFTPVEASDPFNPVEKLRKIGETRSVQLLLTILELGDDQKWMLGTSYLYNDEKQLIDVFGVELAALILKDCQNTLSTRKSKVYSYQPHIPKLLIEAIPPPIHLHLFGSQYDIYPMTRMAKELGWIVSVYCSPGKVHKSLYHIADRIHPYDSNGKTIDPHSACIIMAHDYARDLKNLKASLDLGFPYVGILGPRVRSEKMLDELGVDMNERENLYYPVGLDIGANNPEEISISVLSEIKAHFSQRPGTHLKELDGPIHAI